MVEPWLPDACLVSSRAAQAITQVIDDWATAWFKSDKWQVLGRWDEALDLGTSEFTLLQRKRGMEIKGGPDTSISLAVAILGASPNAQRTAHDDTLLRRLGAQSIEDLGERISQLLPDPSIQIASHTQASFPRVFSLLIGTLGKARIALECSSQYLTIMARGAYPSSPIDTPLCDRNSAIEQVSVKLAALLGAAKIRLRELADLEEGDLLLLDSKPGDPTSLLIEGRPSALAGSIIETPTSLQLELQESR